MLPSQPSRVVHSASRIVDPDVLVVHLCKFLDCLLNVLYASWTAHSVGGEVCVAASAVPVPRNWFRVQSHDSTEILSYSMHQVASHPELVSHLNTLTGPDLELPLS